MAGIPYSLTVERVTDTFTIKTT